MKLKYILGLIVVAALAVLYYRYNPGMYGFFPECPFHKYIGLDCPGCGAQRAVHSLLHGDMLGALNYNALLVISLPVLLVHFLLKVWSYFSKRNFNWNIWYKPATPKVIIAVVLLFWVLRNIPVHPFTYLAS